MYFSSLARIRLALGPGSAVLSLGPVKVLLIMSSSRISSRFSVVSGPHFEQRTRREAAWVLELRAKSYSDSQSNERKERLVAAEEIGAHMRRQNGKVPAGTGASLDPARPEKRNVAIQAHRSYNHYIPGLIAP